MEWKKVEVLGERGGVVGAGGWGGGGEYRLKFAIRQEQLKLKLKHLQYCISVFTHFYAFVPDVREPKGIQQQAVCKPGGSSWWRLKHICLILIISHLSFLPSCSRCT